MNERQKNIVYEDDVKMTRERFGGTIPPGSCLEMAWNGLLYLRSIGAPRVLLQAGSASWPRINADQDDGKMNTHFTYLWDERAVRAKMRDFLALSVKNGFMYLGLPEMHIWLCMPDDKVIIDFTTGMWPEAALALTGNDWPGNRPPTYFWSDKLPPGVVYNPDKSAIQLTYLFLEMQGRYKPTGPLVWAN